MAVLLWVILGDGDIIIITTIITIIQEVGIEESGLCPFTFCPLFTACQTQMR